MVKRPGREADHLPQTNIEVKNEWSYISAPHGMHKYNFTLKWHQIERSDSTWCSRQKPWTASVHYDAALELDN